MIAARSMSMLARGGGWSRSADERGSAGATIVVLSQVDFAAGACQTRSRCASAMSADGAAVVQVVLELVGLGQRADDRDDGVGFEHRPERHDRVDGVVAEHDDAIAAR